ncbi:HlyD family secretion protein [Aetokthonos hydrillicola Thurmond2011]|jgi:HlyD family secretion protein|uniref:HlyD family secretion protein n=1 Tax=Aetokthonos hydrillicola Thurmond2011 TaxID=2712845 RepID=A0AAP5ICU9_9CYAN|nr:HlyD family efflux transporter periplasmic adaptor subunit [Aetokthonos hydrillicola]MBO3458830.1 HlyD family efflux transporter periplasmic adaptor subunit [Aetokthonos hydrillicola CCALA 1050]MBW4587323.1 HlyD family secretion protein [Aetokthonos hydrillicola CCALA 1050]MDR9896655.1 HlyD family secretion protein [Aetokthonos hydrillicola Thurmond2011]
MVYTERQRFLPSVQSDEFLPPVSPWTSLAGVFLLGSVGAAFSLASSVKYNVTVKGGASVRPVGNLKIVQPEFDGTVKQILVKENQKVKEGDPIVRLDDEQLQIKQSQTKGNIEQSQLQLIQLYAQIRSLDVQILAQRKVIEQTVSTAKVDLARNLRDYQEKQVTTTSDSLAAIASLQKTETDLQKAKADLDFAKVDRERYRQLSETGAVGKRDYEQRKLTVAQAQSVVEGQLKAIEIARSKVQATKAALNPTEAMVKIAQENIKKEIASGEAAIATLNKEKQSLLQRRAEIQSQINQSQKELQQINKQIKHSVIRATSDGTILKLNIYNSGQVVHSSDAIAQIVPYDAPLVIKTMVSTADIKKVNVDQKVQIRVDACPYPDYGTLNGVVKAISPDAITSQTSSSGAGVASSAAPTPSYFEVTVQPEKFDFGHGEHQCHLQAGMAATSDIISREETPMQFLLRRARIITDL